MFIIGFILYVLIGFIFALIVIGIFYKHLEIDLGTEGPFFVGILFFTCMFTWPLLALVLFLSAILYGIGYILTQILER